MLPWSQEPVEKKNQNHPEQNEASSPQGSETGEFDPLREKLVREEAGGAAPGKEPGHSHEEEEAAVRNGRKADFITRVILGGVSLAMKEVANVRGDHWRLSDGEKQSLGDALYPVTLKYVEKVWMPVWLDRYQEEMGFAWALIVVLYAKMEIDGKIVDSKKGEGAGGDGKEV